MGAAMTLRERMMALLTARPGLELCAGCIAEELGVRHKSAHQAALKLEAARGFRRQYGRCAACGKTRLIATATVELAGTAIPSDALSQP
jgi:hypothetical protein